MTYLVFSLSLIFHFCYSYFLKIIFNTFNSISLYKFTYFSAMLSFFSALKHVLFGQCLGDFNPTILFKAKTKPIKQATRETVKKMLATHSPLSSTQRSAVLSQSAQMNTLIFPEEWKNQSVNMHWLHFEIPFLLLENNSK